MSSNKGPEKRAHCDTCDTEVKPKVKDGVVTLFVLLTLLSLVSLAASLLAAAHTFAHATVHGAAIIVLWPVALTDHGWAHHQAAAVVLAFVVMVAVAWVCVRLNERAERNTSCPQCGGRLTTTPAPRS